MTPRLILTCEHADNRVPPAYSPLFRGCRRVLASHRGWDLGALDLAKAFERRLSAPLFYLTFTRLLVEANRSLGHPRLFSEFTAGVNRETKLEIIEKYYRPHRDRVTKWIEQSIAEGTSVLHVAVHTFTPELNGRARNADVGLLYDPRRPAERRHCDLWCANLSQRRPELRVRRNYPYLGKSDGLTTMLRRRFGPEHYAGIELEVNQLWPRKSASEWRTMNRDLVQSFVEMLSEKRG